MGYKHQKIEIWSDYIQKKDEIELNEILKPISWDITPATMAKYKLLTIVPQVQWNLFVVGEIFMFDTSAAGPHSQIGETCKVVPPEWLVVLDANQLLVISP